MQHWCYQPNHSRSIQVSLNDKMNKYLFLKRTNRKRIITCGIEFENEIIRSWSWMIEINCVEKTIRLNFEIKRGKKNQTITYFHYQFHWVAMLQVEEEEMFRLSALRLCSWQHFHNPKSKRMSKSLSPQQMMSCWQKRNINIKLNKSIINKTYQFNKVKSRGIA